MKTLDIELHIMRLFLMEAVMSETRVMSSEPKKSKRDRGTGTLIPPRPGVSRFWAAQIRDINGKLVRRTRLQSGAKVSGELKPGCDPKQVTSWTNLPAARELLKQVVDSVSKGSLSVGNDPNQVQYADIRALYIQDKIDNKHRSLRKNAETGEFYVDCLGHLDAFFGYTKPGDKGMKATRIAAAIPQFKNERKADGASNGTINRALNALRRMFTLATDNSEGPALLQPQHAPKIKRLPEGEPRQGFLEIADYDRLHAAFPEYVQNLLQLGFYTGLRREEIVSLTWSQVHLDSNTVELFNTKNGESRVVPLIDGLPELLQNLKDANPTSDGNDRVFLNKDGEEIGSFEKVWQNTCVRLGIPANLYGRETASHFSKGYDPAKGLDCCACCKAQSEYYNDRPVEVGEYVGFLFHDLRRTAISNFRKAGVDPITTMSISGHKDAEVFRRYNIVNTDDLNNAASKVADLLKAKREDAAKAPKLARLQAVKTA